MSTHDPRKVVEDLRDHLAAHDKTLIFLFGAGTSSSINIAPLPAAGAKREHKPLVPAVKLLTERCKAAVKNLGTNFEKAWEILESQCTECKKPANIENILSRIHFKIDAIGKGEKLLDLEKSDLEKLETSILKTIAGAANPKKEDIPENLPHDDFATWIKCAARTAPVEIFTTNYDILIERSLEAMHIPVFDGFVGSSAPFFYADSLDRSEIIPPSSWIRLWKIHGSINWKIAKNKLEQKIIRYSEPIPSGEMILPSHRKYDESRKQPYLALLDRLSNVLNKEHAMLITCGYSFGDEHINAIIFNNLDNRPTTHVISLQYEELSSNVQLVEWAKRRSNFTVLGPSSGVISGRLGTWRLIQPVDDKSSSFMDVAFDSKACVEVGTVAPAVAVSADNFTGTVRLGDFNWLCKFLNTMGRKIG
ncbi:MAG: SIR2 family protein [Candidatus Omnitrophica bacterium]|nr:SIR2 family protein [Candidatus Omnitrophota bacterium]